MKIIPIFLIFLISLSQCNIIRKTRRSKHGEDCLSNSSCEEGLVCKINRCYTPYEADNLSKLGLEEKNVCNLVKKCKGNLVCYKHRCIDSLLAAEYSKPKPPVNPEEEEDISMVFSGSIFLNKMPYLSGLKTDNTFDYTHLFTHVTNFIKHADISVAFEETPFYINQNQNKKIKTDFKNTPKELGNAIANAGFKTVVHASSSAYDKSDAGIINTLSFWNNEHPDVKVLGISKSTVSENNYHIFEKNGVKIAIINFATQLTKSLPKDKNYMVNMLTKEKIELIMASIKNQADFFVACVNWGVKGDKKPSNKQIHFAKMLIAAGVNLIIGNNPDYVQPVSYVKAANGNCGLVFFSLGLFIGDGKNNLGSLAHLIITKDKTRTYISSYSLRPTINHKVNTKNYSVYRLHEYTQELGHQSTKKVDVVKLRKVCKKIMGAFAYC